MKQLQKVMPVRTKLSVFSKLFGVNEKPDPNFIYFDKGYDKHIDKDDYNGALEILCAAIKKKPSSPYFNSCIGFLYKIVEDYNQAILFLKNQFVSVVSLDIVW